MYTDMRALETPVTTTVQLQTLLTLLARSSVDRVKLFAGAAAPEAPAIVLLATGRFAGIGPAHVVYDALTLNVIDAARYAELRELLDLAVSSGKSFFSHSRAPTTCTMAAKQAISTLRMLRATNQLTHQSLSECFALLSALSEVEITDVKRTLGK